MRSPFQRGDRTYTSEADVCGRQILTHEEDPRVGRVKYNSRGPIT